MAISLLRLARQPGRHRISTDPLPMGQRLAFAKRTVETRIAERTTALDAGAGDLALDRREFKRKRPHLLRKTCQRFGLETLDVDFDEGWLAVLCNQGIQRCHWYLNCSCPALGFPARSTMRGADKFPRRARDGRIAWIDHQVRRTVLPADRNGLNCHCWIPAVQQFQHRDHRRLRFDRNDART
jgi:hypothetical protein